MNTVIILRGVPGSGKSSFVKMLKGTNTDVTVHAIDDLHVDENGDFFWKEDEQDKLYLLNYCNFVNSMKDQMPLIVVDCINVKTSDFSDYIQAARMFNYHVYVVTPDMPNVDDAAKRNKHHVSSLQIKQMYKDWEPWPSQDDLNKKIRDCKKNETTNY